MTRPFKKPWIGRILSPEERSRESRVVRLAQAAFGSPERVRAFLNSHHDGLEGRPLDLAVASDDGLAAVEAVLPEAEAGR